ncbi:Peroxisomal biogenesis factor 11 (PEX11) [Popillia japonica]|uniref:Peroxisomal biogenesis factor 11 (PEX11) n=1 Tax=Popillia japonica TaxID=7064 RepID=A0AAW1ITI6_POPJA
MSKFPVLDEICNVLETYKGRDKFLRTICYSTKLISGLTSDPLLAKRMQNVSSQMSAARLILRLLDDLPMLKYAMEYGFGEEENDKLMASLGVITNVIDILYYPIEKVAWLAEHRLISGYNVEPWDTASSIFWSASIYLTLMKTLRYVLILQQHKTCADLSADKQIGLEKLIARQRYEILTCIRMSLDFIHAVNTLPPGFLWSSKLKTWHVGFIATFSSCEEDYILFNLMEL